MNEQKIKDLEIENFNLKKEIFSLQNDCPEVKESDLEYEIKEKDIYIKEMQDKYARLLEEVSQF